MGKVRPYADIEWRNGFPYARSFDDIYFTDDGIAESRFVFLNGIGLSNLIKQVKNPVIAETGFGTGLNFLLTAEAFLEMASPDAILTFLSVEGYPFRKQDLEKALHALGTFSGLAAELIQDWPQPISGTHSIRLAKGRVRLILTFDDIESAIDTLNFKAHGWYLDGFAPAKNPDMWQEKYLNHVFERTAHGGRLATFTAAGFVKRGLEKAGFRVEKSPGFGRKRERLLAQREKSGGQNHAIPQKIAVIGSGIAGASIARTLHDYGLNPIVFDGADNCPPAASGNRLALLNPKLMLGTDPYCRFYDATFDHALRSYSNWGYEPFKTPLFMPAKNDESSERFKKVLKTYADTFGLNLTEKGLNKSSAIIEPEKLIRHLLDGIEVIPETIGKIHHEKNIQITDQTGKPIWSGDHVVIAAGAMTNTLTPQENLPIRPVSGQVMDWPNPNPALPDTPIAWGHYYVSYQNHALFGATFRKEINARLPSFTPRKEDRKALWQEFNSVFGADKRPDIKTVHERLSVRATTPDHMPLAGILPESGGKISILTGLGSHGFQTAPLIADMLASEILGLPCPVEQKIRKALLPERFLK